MKEPSCETKRGRYRFADCLNYNVRTYQPIDLRRKTYKCINCHELHPTKHLKKVAEIVPLLQRDPAKK